MAETSILDADVVVAGGGSAGVAAAVSAARAGARVCLIERLNSLGGMGSAALVHTICGLYETGTKPGAAVFANVGFPPEFARRLLGCGGARGPVRMGAMEVLLHEPKAFAALAERMVGEVPGLRVLGETSLTAAHRETGGWLLEAHCRGERLRVKARTLVDTTGDAGVAHLSGHATLRADAGHLQRPAYIVKLGGVRPDALTEVARMRLLHALVRATRERSLPEDALGSGLRSGVGEGDAFLTIDLFASGENYDPTDAECLSEVERQGRDLARIIVAWLIDRVEGFADARIMAYPERLGIRESRRLHGRLVLEEDDLAGGRDFPDTVARSAWPIEMREQARGAKWRSFESGRPGNIPLRTLIAARDDRLFAAGRCVSASHRALGSLRVMGTCFATGEAAGIAAALVALGAGEVVGDLTSLAASVREIRARFSLSL